MAEHIRQLLDDAVAGLEPKSPDPVAAVVARGRAARRRTMAAAVLLCAGLASGVVAITRQGSHEGPMRVADLPVVGLPAPHVADGVVMAGAVRLPVPPGWRVVTEDPRASCADLADTILLIIAERRGCQYAAVEVSRSAIPVPPTSGGSHADLMSEGLPGPPPVPITLSGGEPAWTMDRLDSEPMLPDGKEPGHTFWQVVVLPWSQVSLELRVDGPRARKILESIQSTPHAAGMLQLPATAAAANLFTPDASGHLSAKGYGRTTDPAAIGRVLKMLRAQKAVTDAAATCAKPEDHSARLTLYTADEGGPSSSAPDDTATSADDTVLVLTLGENCYEAVSSDGGRVRLSREAVTELKQLFGIGAQ
ncbi:MAG TPA: hypothetical protein VF657_17235 [Actinoplanes sp.]|jgi:hypothetical protein